MYERTLLRHYIGFEVLVYCEDRPHEPYYLVESMLTANSRVFEKIIDEGAPNCKYLTVLQPRGDVRVYATCILHELFGHILDIWLHNYKISDLVESFKQNSIDMLVTLKKIKSDYAQQFPESLCHVVKHELCGKALKFFIKSLEKNQKSLFEMLRQRCPQSFEEEFLNKNVNMKDLDPLLSKYDVRSVLNDYGFGGIAPFFIPSKVLVMPHTIDFTRPEGFDVMMRTSDDLTLYASKEALVAAFQNGDEFFSAHNFRNVRVLRVKKTMPMFECRHPSNIMKQVLHEIHTNTTRSELPIEVILWIIEVSKSLGFCFVVSRLSQLFTKKDFIITAQVMEMVCRWNNPEIKSPLWLKISNIEILKLLGMHDDAPLFGSYNVPLYSCKNSSTCFTPADCRAILRRLIPKCSHFEF